MKSLGKYRIYNIVATNHVCTQGIYSDGKGTIYVAHGTPSRRTYHKINFDKYFVERVRITSPIIPITWCE